MGASDPNTQFYATLAGAPNSSVVMSGNTTLDLSAANMGFVTLGSLADAPGSPTGQQVLLGGNTLQTGLDNSSTTFSGGLTGSGLRAAGDEVRCLRPARLVDSTLVMGQPARAGHPRGQWFRLLDRPHAPSHIACGPRLPLVDLRAWGGVAQLVRAAES